MKFKMSTAKDIKPSLESIEAEQVDADKIGAMFQEVVKAFKDKFCCFDLSHMRCFTSPIPINHDGDPKTNEADKIKYTGSWTKLDKIYVNPDMTKAMEFYGITGQVSQEDLQKQAIAHELAHELYEYQMGDDCIEKILKKAEDLKFDTPYLHHIDDDDPKEELFCEYMAYRVTGIWVKIVEKQATVAAPAKAEAGTPTVAPSEGEGGEEQPKAE